MPYDYRDPHHVERYGKLVVRNPDGSTERKHPRDADVDVMREVHDPAPLLRVMRPLGFNSRKKSLFLY
jgi:hypothetical protein